MTKLMKRSWPLFLIVGLASACGGYGSSYTNSPPAAGATVIDWHVGATGVQTSVKAGTPVQWRSTDGMAHTVTSSTSAFGQIEVAGGGLSAPAVFNTPGTFPYFCSIHGANVMNGTLTVAP